MTSSEQSNAWVFVSHAGADLAKVRLVRNFLEQQNASPILFHLKSMSHPRKFWPVIRDEIMARNFFLFCDSEAARSSQWVQRERSLVERLGRKRPVRIGRIAVDGDLDCGGLQRFVRNLNYYAYYPWYEGQKNIDFSDISNVMSAHGYGSLGAIGLSHSGLKQMLADEHDRSDTRFMVRHAAQNGWLLVVVDRALASDRLLFEMLPALRRAEDAPSQERVMFVLTEAVAAESPIQKIDQRFVVPPARRFHDSMTQAAQRMLMIQ